MIKAIVRGIVIGAAVVAIPVTGWVYYDVAVNHMDMFGYASVYLAGCVGAGIGGVFGGLSGFVAEGRRRARSQR